MSSHRATTVRRRRRPVPSVRVRAVLGLGVALGVGAIGTLAAWTDDVPISGTTFTAGTLNLKVNNAESYATTTLTMGAMVPGSTSSEVLTVNNTASALAKYTLVGGLSGTDAAQYSAAGANGLLLTIRQGGTKSGSTCIDGTVLVTDQPLTNVTTAAILAKRPTTALAANSGSEALCFQVRLSPNAPTDLQGRTASATFTVRGTTDLS